MKRNQAKPGYLEFRPPSYQVLGPEEESTLDRILVTYPSEQGTTMDPLPTARFWVRTPQVRCRVRVSVFSKPDQPALGNPNLADPDVDPITDMYDRNASGQLGLLWVAEHERGNGSGLKAAPVRNVVGTGDVPLSIPTDVRLWGYTFELETCGTELYGVFVPPNNSDPDGALTSSRWHVTARYESVVPVSDEEWNQFLGKQLLRVSPQDGVIVEGGSPP